MALGVETSSVLGAFEDMDVMDVTSSLKLSDDAALIDTAEADTGESRPLADSSGEEPISTPFILGDS